jgi:hypothetical protein
MSGPVDYDVLKQLKQVHTQLASLPYLGEDEEGRLVDILHTLSNVVEVVTPPLDIGCLIKKC